MGWAQCGERDITWPQSSSPKRGKKSPRSLLYAHRKSPIQSRHHRHPLALLCPNLCRVCVCVCVCVCKHHLRFTPRIPRHLHLSQVKCFHSHPHKRTSSAGAGVPPLPILTPPLSPRHPQRAARPSPSSPGRRTAPPSLHAGKHRELSVRVTWPERLARLRSGKPRAASRRRRPARSAPRAPRQSRGRRGRPGRPHLHPGHLDRHR